MSYKEDGRLKPADPKEIADIKKYGKLFECGICGFSEKRFKVEFSDLPKCPKCKSGSMTEKLEV